MDRQSKNGDHINEDRPFIYLRSADIRDRGIQAFKENDILTLYACYKELKDHRKPKSVTCYLEELERLLRIMTTYAYLDKDEPAPSYEWLQGVADVVDSFTSETSGRTHIYLVCL